jgi:hypothetical protein
VVDDVRVDGDGLGPGLEVGVKMPGTPGRGKRRVQPITLVVSRRPSAESSPGSTCAAARAMAVISTGRPTSMTA